MNQKIKYKDPSLISFNACQSLGADCGSNGSGATDNCNPTGISAAKGCGNGSSAQNCYDFGFSAVIGCMDGSGN